MNNENGELSDVKTQKNPTKQLRKPVKRLNAEVRGVVTPENSPKKLGNSQTAPAVESRHTISRRSSMAYKNFLGKFRRSNPRRLTVEASYRKRPPEEVPPLEIVNDIESERQIHNDQLQETRDSNKRSWLSFNCVSKALSKAKNLFS